MVLTGSPGGSGTPRSAPRSAVVAEEGGQIVGFASTSSYRPRECYAKIAEFSVYVARDHRGRGVGRRALEALIEESRSAGLHKLVSRISENISSRAACRSVGFREVGIYEAHGQTRGRLEGLRDRGADCQRGLIREWLVHVQSDHPNP